ncbi:MAG: O-Antigen ligase [Parcubacteria group bacterium ADurb.Bin316]|nr:MAG: O-Antigen ligase [Parcubacteria group bacterium ADurb.Bin316]HOZ56495.1 O-antigen ligase family protein [bacterium]
MFFLRLIRIANITSFFLILAVVLLTPIFFSYFWPTANTFELPKSVLFKLLVLLILAATAIEKILIFKSNVDFFSALKKNRKYLAAIFLFLSSLLVSTIFSIDSTKSFYGIYERQQGFLFNFFCLLFFLLVLININSAKKFRAVLITICASSFFVCAYGLMQKLGYDFVKWSESFSDIGRITSTFGQPNFLASYLLLVMPVTIFLIWNAEKSFFKLVFFIIFLFQSACLFFTYSLGGWVGFGVGLVITVATFLIKNRSFFNNSIAKKRHSFIYLLVILILFLFFILFIQNFSNDAILKYKINSLFNWQSSSASTRINFWRASSRAIAQKPFWGHGLEMQGDVLVGYYQKNWGALEGVNSYPDRAHNFFLDSLLVGGLVNLVAFLFLLFVFFSSAWQKNWRNGDSFLILVFLWALVAYLVSLFFSFAIVVTSIYFWLYLALILALLDNNIRNEEANEVIYPLEQEKKLAFRVFLTLSVVVLIFYQINKEFNRLVADYYAGRMQVALESNEISSFLEISGYLNDDVIKTKYYHNQIISALINFSSNPFFSNYQAQINRLALRLLLSIKSESYSDILNKARIYYILANGDNHDYFNKSEHFYDQIKKYSPEMPKVYYELGNLYAKKGDYDLAIDNYEKALSKLPSLDESVLNQKHIEAIRVEKKFYYLSLGNIAVEKGDYIKSDDYYKSAIQNKDKDDYSIYFVIARSYYLREEWNRALYFVEEAHRLDPGNYFWPLSISQIYQDKNDKSKALWYARAALRLNPENQSVAKLVASLEK